MANPSCHSRSGADYARNSILFLEILTVANMLRLCVLPYFIVVLGNGRQRDGFVAAIGEAVVNLIASVALAAKFGAIGVAAGTFIGAIFGFGLTVLFTMKYTFAVIPVRRVDFLWRGLARPSACAIPLFAFLLLSQGNVGAHGFLPPVLILFLTPALLWTVGLTGSDREIFGEALHNWRLRRSLQA